MVASQNGATSKSSILGGLSLINHDFFESIPFIEISMSEDFVFTSHRVRLARAEMKWIDQDSSLSMPGLSRCMDGITSWDPNCLHQRLRDGSDQKFRVDKHMLGIFCLKHR